MAKGQELESVKPEDLAALQGEIRAYRRMLSLPKSLESDDIVGKFEGKEK